MPKLKRLDSFQRSLKTWIVSVSENIDFLGLIILIGILRLRSLFSLVLLTILINSSPSLVMVRALLSQIRGTLGHAKMVMVVNKTILRQQESTQSQSRKTNELKKTSAKWSVLAATRRVTISINILTKSQKTSIDLDDLQIDGQA